MLKCGGWFLEGIHIGQNEIAFCSSQSSVFFRKPAGVKAILAVGMFNEFVRKIKAS